MSYLVLARKYRPQSFEDVVKQEHVTRTLANAISAGRVAHAMLFSGPRGTGKTTIARILAKAMNCEKGPSPVPCNVCRSCKEITAGSASDVFEIDGASNNGVEHIRELRENIKYTPVHSAYKIYIIDEVHMLSTSAFNALLKTLEEPPPHVLFIFATTELHKVPATIHMNPAIPTTTLANFALIILVPFIFVVLSVITKLFFLGIKKCPGFENPPFKVGRLQRLSEFFGFSAMHLPRDCGFFASVVFVHVSDCPVVTALRP
jgi:energy-coupling factor transporter ATP-binding protein EcfA2